jgi:DNA-binding CsgD family transcriptional regulator
MTSDTRRIAPIVRGQAWGSVHIARRAGSGPFDRRDVEALGRLTGAIARGIRTSLRFDAARRGTGAAPPGLVVVGPGDAVEIITPPARELLDALGNTALGYAEGSLPAAVLALASHVRSERFAAGAGTDVVTVPSAAGWITLHASRTSEADGRVAIVVERSSGTASATLRLEVHGATSREREVATLLARGATTAEIAAALTLSQHTVQDHVKSLFEKLGVASRQELVARVFLDEYVPEIVAATPIGSRGRFERGGAVSPRQAGGREPVQR